MHNDADMKSKFLLCLALVLSGGIIGYSQTNKTEIPLGSAPPMRQCREAKVKDLGIWDDALRFADQDAIVLRKGDALFSYSLVTDRLKQIRVTNDLAGVHLIDGITWKNQQWVFCQSVTAMPFAMDLADGKTVTFEMPGVSADGMDGPDINAIINSGVRPATIVVITGDEAKGWPREGNRPLYFWMDLESGKVMKFPMGWDLNYFSADQSRAVFENISTNSKMYRPWVTVDMATGGVIDELPDQTEELWSSMDGLWQTVFNPYYNYDYRRYVWELRSPRTKMKPYPQPGRGYADDTFAGLSVNGTSLPLTVPGIGVGASCLDAKVAGNLAVFAIANDGHTERWLWAAWLDQNESPRLLATNRCVFEMLDHQRCVLLLSSAAPEIFVYDAASNCVWNVLDGTSPETNTTPVVRTGVWPAAMSGAGPMMAYKLIPGFGSARYPTKVLCLCSTGMAVSDNMIPPPVKRLQILLTDKGQRYQANLPPDMRDRSLNDAWLHNSGKLVINQSGHLYVVDLRGD